MSEYVPSEDELRHEWQYSFRHAEDWEAAREGFDRFLAQVRTDAYNWGRYDERMSHAYAPPEAGGSPFGF